jgi:protein O-mannosyl-transferase
MGDEKLSNTGVAHFDSTGGLEPTRSASANAPSHATWIGVTLVLALTFAVYIPTLRYGFVHDDRGQIVENPAVHSWRALPSYFTAQVWAGVKPEDLGNYYRPLFLLWLRLNDVAFGNHAWGWHLSTILTHVLATLFVYLLAWRLGVGREVALLAALIFGLHPAHIEAVAWISGVTEPLLGILLIASFLAYVQWRLSKARQWRVLSLALFVLAILEKETALVLPGLLLVYEWIFVADWGKPLELRALLTWCGRALRRIFPYFLLIALYVPARIYALKGFNHVVTPLSATQLFFTWPKLIGFWIRHLIWPAGLSTFYDFPAVLHPTMINFIVPALFDLGVALALYACVRKSRQATFFAVWLALPLIPLLNIRVFIANDFAHDRYLYLPSVGLGVLLAMLLKKVCVGPPRWDGLPASLLGAALLLTATMSYATIADSFYFKDNLTFYAYNLMKAPHNPDAEANYATVLAEDGQFGPALGTFLDVIHHYPNYWTPTYNLALTYYKLGNLPEAEAYFRQAIHINPHNPDQYFYLGMTRFKAGQSIDATACLRQAIAIRPTGYAYHFALGMILQTQGDLPAALREFKEELANNPQEHGAEIQIEDLKSRMAAGK